MGKCVFCVLCILCVFLQQNPKKYGQDLMFFFQETWQSNVAASRQSLTNVFCVFCVFFWNSYVRYYAVHVFYVFYVFFSGDMTEQCCSFQTITDPCVLCVLCVFLEIIRQILCRACVLRVLCVFFQETWQSNVAESRQSMTYVFCVFCVFFFYFILQILCRACVLRVLCVFFLLQ